MTTAIPQKTPVKEELEEDKELQSELKVLVDKITGNDTKLIPSALEMLKYLIRTSTTSMTSVPKPLKYLACYYELLKNTHKNMPKGNTKNVLADVISVLAMGTAGGEEARKQRDCLKYCLMGTMKNIGDWGHEYIRQLEAEIVQQWTSAHCDTSDKMLMPLINDIIQFNCSHNAEIQACDLLMEIDRLSLLPKYIAQSNYQRMCYYLMSCARYVDDIERNKIMKLTYDQYMTYREYSRALILALQMNNDDLVTNTFSKCKDKVILAQLAFICARHLYPVDLDTEKEEYDDLNNIVSNSLLSSYFLVLARELDVMEPKLPEDVYKTWLEPVPPKLQILGENLDSARQNLASSFVNGFVNAGFGSDKLLSNDTGNKWIYRNKDHGMLSATASLGLIHLWDVDGGLTPIDKYLYTSEDYIKAGALLALGIVNCRVRNECDPALALLGDYIGNANEALQIGSILGIGLAYAGTMKNIGDWGHEYIRQLEAEIVQQWTSAHCDTSDKMLMPLINDIIQFNCSHNAEIQACDLLMEIDRLSLLPKYIAQSNYQRMCYYLMSCARYVDDIERNKIMKLTYDQYMTYREYSRALILALQMNNDDLVTNTFSKCKDKVILAQLAFICARHLYPVDLDTEKEEYDDLNNIVSNSLLSSYFLVLARELDVMEPKLPEDVYKTWLEPVPPKLQILGENLDSARQNLASSFVNGFVNAGFGSDKLLSNDTGNKWIYRNKDHGMLSATASLGLIHLWDVDGGLTPIDKYLYTSEDYIKAGALLALGIVNCRVRNECDPALALLGDYIGNANEALQIGSILGIGLAYAGSQRDDVLNLILPIISSSKSPEVLAITSLSCGLVSLGKNDSEVPSAIVNVMIEMGTQDPDCLKSVYMKLTGLGVALCYLGARDAIEVSSNAMEVFPEPFKSTMQTMLLMCAYAGTGDVLIIQELLGMVGEKIEVPEKDTTVKEQPKGKDGPKIKRKKTPEWDYTMAQAMATLAVASVSFGEEIGMEMVQRIFGQMGRYGEPSIRKAIPLAIALSSVSDPQLPVLDVLTKYSHDSDDDVACNAIFGLGLIGSGTNNARLAAGLRQLAVFHSKNPSQLFMVRISQGLVHMGKGTVTLNPLHTDRMLLDPVGMAGLLITTVSLLEPHSLILTKAHYLLYCLAVTIQPRWLLTLDDKLEVVQTTVRVGQAVDVVGKAGTPKTISGIHTHTTPVLLAVAERAELATDQFEQYAPTLNGICVLRKNPEV